MKIEVRQELTSTRMALEHELDAVALCDLVTLTKTCQQKFIKKFQITREIEYDMLFKTFFHL